MSEQVTGLEEKYDDLIHEEDPARRSAMAAEILEEIEELERLQRRKEKKRADQLRELREFLLHKEKLNKEKESLMLLNSWLRTLIYERGRRRL